MVSLPVGSKIRCRWQAANCHRYNQL